ncbi:carboxylesterase [Acrasis kona]|uniref:Carboxylesterase n=1 Tax=Acrasis kona TaxID=1008807 RepID=A0AAW2Z8B4_9EUKA
MKSILLRTLLLFASVLSACVAYIIFTGPPIDPQLKFIDTLSRAVFYVCGAQPGAKFSRKCLDLLSITAPTTETFSEDGILTRDIEIKSFFEPNVSIPARLFQPAQSSKKNCQEEKLPLVIHYHGGGFTIGSGKIPTYDRTLRSMAKSSNNIILTVDYRLAPEHPHPAAVQDAYSALLYIDQLSKQQDKQFLSRVDFSKVILLGDSAGAGLVYNMAFIKRDKKIPTKKGTELEFITAPPLSIQLANQVLIYPSAREDTPSKKMHHAPLLSKQMLDFFFECYFGNLTMNDNNFYKNQFFYPLKSHTLKDLPPAIFVTAKYDPLRDDGVRMYEKYGEEGLKVWHRQYDTAHGFFFIPSVKDSSDAVDFVVDIWREEKLTGDYKC